MKTNGSTSPLFVTESHSVAESVDGATTGPLVPKRASLQKSGSKPSIVTPLENIEANHGDNILLKVKQRNTKCFYETLGCTIISL